MSKGTIKDWLTALGGSSLGASHQRGLCIGIGVTDGLTALRGEVASMLWAHRLSSLGGTTQSTVVHSNFVITQCHYNYQGRSQTFETGVSAEKSAAR